jgi:hypothetical protein
MINDINNYLSISCLRLANVQKVYLLLSRLVASLLMLIIPI